MSPFGNDLNIDLQGAQPLDRPQVPRPPSISHPSVSKLSWGKLWFKPCVFVPMMQCNIDIHVPPLNPTPAPPFLSYPSVSLAKLMRGRHLWMKSIFYYYIYYYKYLYLLLLVNELHLLLLLLPVPHTTTCGWTPPINGLTRRNPIPSSALTSLGPHFANCKQVSLHFKSISLDIFCVYNSYVWLQTLVLKSFIKL